MLLSPCIRKAAMGRRAEDAAELPREVRPIGETGRMGSIGQILSVECRGDGRAHAAPGTITPERHAHLLGEEVLKPRQGASHEDPSPNVRHGRGRPCGGQRLHMPFPSLGCVERRKDGGYSWLAHTSQLQD